MNTIFIQNILNNNKIKTEFKAGLPAFISFDKVPIDLPGKFLIAGVLSIMTSFILYLVRMPGVIKKVL